MDVGLDFFEGGGVSVGDELGAKFGQRVLGEDGVEFAGNQGTLMRQHVGIPGCNPSALDKKYPYDEARVGSAGWDPLEKVLMSGEDHADFMSYCSPVWVSDYTWSAIHERMNKVTSLIAGKPTETKSFAPRQAPSAKNLSPEQILWTREAL